MCPLSASLLPRYLLSSLHPIYIYTWVQADNSLSSFDRQFRSRRWMHDSVESGEQDVLGASLQFDHATRYLRLLRAIFRRAYLLSLLMPLCGGVPTADGDTWCQLPHLTDGTQG